MKDEKGFTNTNGFEKILDESNCKPNKIWFDKGIEFYNSSMKSFLKNNNIEMYSTHNEKNLLLVKDLLEPSRIKFINTWLQFRKMSILIN